MTEDFGSAAAAAGGAPALGVTVATTSATACPSRSTTLIVNSPARQIREHASAANVTQVAVALRRSATWIPVWQSLPKGLPSADLTWGMAISLTILNSLRGRILALVLGLVIWVLTAAIAGIAVTERAQGLTRAAGPRRPLSPVRQDLWGTEGLESRLWTVAKSDSHDHPIGDATAVSQ
jgi:hypothetical protein